RVEPESLEPLGDGEWLATFPRVLGGWVHLEVDADPGEVVELRLSERLDADGRPDVSDPHGYYAGRFQTHRMTAGSRPLSWEPRFSYQGFQYALVRSRARPRLIAKAVRSSVERTGTFRCSSDALTR